MESLFLWQPTELENHVIETVITPAESFKVGSGGPMFIRSVANALHLAMPLTWKITPFRCQFFTEYDDHWEDRWGISWSLEMNILGEHKLPDLTQGPIGINEWDETWTEKDDVNKVGTMECRVVADFASEAQAKAASQKIKQEGLAPTLLTAGKLARLDVSFGVWKTAEYPARLVEAEQIVGLCKKSGGATRHSDSFRLATC